MKRPVSSLALLFVAGLNLTFVLSHAIEFKVVDGIYSFATKAIPVWPFLASVTVIAIVATGNLSKIVDLAESYFVGKAKR